MLDESVSGFPARVDQPSTLKTGDAFLADLCADGIWETSPRTLLRAICTLGTRFRSDELVCILVPDRLTAAVEYTDGVTYKFEFVFDEGRIYEEEIRTFEQLQTEEADGMILVTNGSVFHCAADYVGDSAQINIANLSTMIWDVT